MARGRWIKPEFFGDEKLAKHKRDIRLLYIGLWVISDDYGTVRSNPVFIRNSIFPYDEDLRISEVKIWLDALSNARMLEPFTFNGESFYNIRAFNVHQRVDNPSKPIVPLEEKNKILEEIMASNNGIDTESSLDSSETVARPSRESRHEVKLKEDKLSKEIGAKALVVHTDDAGKQAKKDWNEKVKELTGKPKTEIWTEIKNFIRDKRPDFIDPYVETWNLFAASVKLSQVSDISEARKKKFKVRIGRTSFDFLKILEKIKTSGHLKGDNDRGWKVNFDWIIENDKNYLKILEGNYD